MNCWLLYLYAFVLFLSFQSSCTKQRNSKSEIFSRGLNQFSAEFYEHLAKTTNGNFVSSPISVAIIAAMAAYGADGNTKKELSDVLHLQFNRTFLRRSFRDFITDINNSKGIEIHSASKLFISNEFPIKRQFQCITNEIFLSEIQSVDFKDAINTAKIINDWCMKKTNNKITDVVTPDAVSGAELAMVNAVYFRAKWINKFIFVSDETFHLSEVKSKSISMMKNTAKYNYGSIFEDTATYIELPYQSSDPKNAYSMYIIIPNEINGLNAISYKLHKINFAELNNSLTEIKLIMPRFKIESELNLKTTLQNMGIRDMFTNNADFSKMTENSHLKITNVFQKAYINVAEEGTEAAAATEMVRITLSIGPKTVVIDKPFISAIVSKNSGIPLFWARVMDPIT